MITKTFLIERDLERIIAKRLNYEFISATGPEFENSNITYDGFDMSGYSPLSDIMNLLSRFNDLIFEQKISIFPVFWEGNGNLISLDKDGSKHKIVVEDIGGWTTFDIIKKIILLSNPELIEK